MVYNRSPLEPSMYHYILIVDSVHTIDPGKPKAQCDRD